MLHNVWGRLPKGLRKRPFDIFVSLFLVGAGVYQIADPNFPEMQQQLVGDFLLTLISIYMIAAGLVITWCILHKCKNIIMNMYIEMYAWLFMWAAMVAIVVFDLYIGFTTPITNFALYYGVLWFWILISIATGIRWIDLNQMLRKVDQ
jgi:hypothetical protein